MHWQILTVLTVIPLLIILYLFYEFFIKIKLVEAKLKKMDPKLAIFTSPFTGLLGQQKKCVEKYGDSHWFVKDIMRQNPDQKAYLTNLGNRPFLIFCDPQLIKQISLNQKKFKKFNIFKHADKAYTKGIFFVENEDWAKQRSIISHSFSHQQLKRMIPIMTSCIKRHISFINKTLEEKKQNSYVYHVLHENQLIIGDILVRSFFSEDAAKKKILGMSMTTALADFTATIFDRSRTGFNLMMNTFFGENVRRINFTKKDKELQILADAIRKQCEAIIDERIANYDESAEEDFLNHYIKEMKSIQEKIKKAEEEGKPHKLRRVTKQQIVHQLITFYFAGIDTTGHLIAMAFYAISQYPECKQKIVEQLKQAIPSPEEITYQKLQQLQYMGKFLDECLRMWPPAVGVLNRVTREQITIGPYKLPKDINIGTNIIGLMHNTKYYKNPETFDPERWNDKSLITAEPYSFIPFSAGPRSCIGKYLALMESKIILIHFLYNFEMKRTAVPLRMHAKLLYEPVDQDLVQLAPGGISKA